MSSGVSVQEGFIAFFTALGAITASGLVFVLFRHTEALADQIWSTFGYSVVQAVILYALANTNFVAAQTEAGVHYTYQMMGNAMASIVLAIALILLFAYSIPRPEHHGMVIVHVR